MGKKSFLFSLGFRTGFAEGAGLDNLREPLFPPDHVLSQDGSLLEKVPQFSGVPLIACDNIPQEGIGRVS